MLLFQHVFAQLFLRRDSKKVILKHSAVTKVCVADDLLLSVDCPQDIEAWVLLCFFYYYSTTRTATETNPHFLEQQCLE